MPTQTVGFDLPLLQPVSIASGPVVNVSQFGAVGDGTKDDTAAIQSALNYIKANGGTLNFDAGRTYIVSKSLVIQAPTISRLTATGQPSRWPMALRSSRGTRFSNLCVRPLRRYRADSGRESGEPIAR